MSSVPDFPADVHALRAYLQGLSARVLRDLANGMPYRHESRKVEIVEWLVRYEPGVVRAHRAEAGR